MLIDTRQRRDQIASVFKHVNLTAEGDCASARVPRPSVLRKDQFEALAECRDTAEIHVDSVTLVEPRELRHITANIGKIPKILLEPRW